MVEQMDLFMASAMEEKPKQPQITEEQIQKVHETAAPAESSMAQEISAFTKKFLK